MKKSLAFIITAFILMSLGGAVAFAESSNVQESLRGKTALFAGDSICAADCECDHEKYSSIKGWAARIAEANDMTVENAGVGGATVSDYREDNRIIQQLEKKSGNQYDYVIMHGGVNDAWNRVKIGSVAEGFDSEFDESTFAGALEATFKYAKASFPDAKLGFIINFRLPGAPYGNLPKLGDYFEAAKDICDKWEVEYLDLYSDDDFNVNVLKTDTNEFLSDYVHPTSEGYDVLAPVINDWLISLSEKEEDTSVEDTSGKNESSKSVATVSDSNNAIADQPNQNSYLGYAIASAALILIVAAAVFFVKHKKNSSQTK